MSAIKKKLFNCDDCGKTYTSWWALKYHRELHLDPDKRTKFDCDQCDMSFILKTSLARHIEAVHKKIKPYTCSECDKSFSYKHVLNKHIQSHVNPNDRQKFCCKECNKTYFTRAGLHGHVKAKHKRFKKLICSWPGCQWKASYQSSLRIHIDSVHEKRQQYPCPLKTKDESCSQMFRRKADAKKHYEYAHLNILIPCFLASCGRTFSGTSQARAHYRRVHEGDSAKWRCPQCRKLLINSNSLLRHIDAVHKNIHIECSVCNKSFVSNSALQYHTIHAHNKNSV